MLNGQEASKLISTTRFSLKELDVLQDPDVVKKIRALYANIMKSGIKTWKTLAYL